MKIDKIIVKVASRCNINCSYCYMYNLGDLSYKMQPKFIEPETIKNFAEKLLKHLLKNEISIVGIIIHGGEPLMMKKSDFVNFIKSFDIIKMKNIKVIFSLQTNAVLVDDEWCDLFKQYNINVGVSLDGPKEENDMFRVDKKGNGTYDRVIEGINTFKRNNFRNGVLSVMNLKSDPIKYYEHFKSLNLNSVDILLLDGNHDSKESIFKDNISPSDWYITIFNKWYNDNDHHVVKIRFFDMIIKEILGEEQDLDSIGVHENNVLVLETNGGLEAVDVLKLCGDSFTKNDININTHEIDVVSQSALIEIYYNSGKYLPKKCLACPIQNICGGGYLPHRYSSDNGFNNPTIYCNDIIKIVTHIQNSVIDSMPNDFQKNTGIEKLTYENALQIIEETLPTIKEPEYIKKLESFKKSEYKIYINETKI